MWILMWGRPVEDKRIVVSCSPIQKLSTVGLTVVPINGSGVKERQVRWFCTDRTCACIAIAIAIAGSALLNKTHREEKRRERSSYSYSYDNECGAIGSGESDR